MVKLPGNARPADERIELIRRLGSSHFNYWFGYVANLALVGFLASRGFGSGQLLVSPTAAALLGAGGLLSWTLSEYLLHRFVYHALPSFLSQGHDLHHREPRALIGVPWYLTAVALLLIYFAVSRLAGPAPTGLFMAGNWFGYVLYCLAHHGSHHWSYRLRWLRWLRRMRRHHLVHHALPECNWGFTTTLWDRVFGTYCDRPPARRRSSGHGGPPAR